MGTTWGRLVGDTAQFAVDLAFLRDPDEGRAAAAEESLSWGALQVWVGGKNVCAYTCNGERSDAVHWYILPLLEWIADNWNPLLHEEKLPEKNSGECAATALPETEFAPFGLTGSRADQWEEGWQGWWRRHCLLAARQGGIYPNLVIRRWRDRIELSWESSRLPGLPTDFQFMTPSGFARVLPEVVATPLHEICHEAAMELRSRLPRSPRLKRLISKLEGLERDDPEERIAWMAGLGISRREVVRHWREFTLQLEDQRKRSKEAVLEVERDRLVIRGSSQAALMFGSLSPRLTEEDVTGLTRKLIECYDPNGDPQPLRDLRVRLGLEDQTEKPWEEGYRLAEQVLEQTGLGGETVRGVDVQSLLDRLHIGRESIRLADSTVRAASIAGTHHRPTILTNESYDANRLSAAMRFSLAHELCHILFDRDRGEKVAIASGPWAPIEVEKRANAFAAMLLMPRSAVWSAVRSARHDISTLAGIRFVARALNTSAAATLEHLCNLGLIDEVTRDRVRQEALEPTEEAPAQEGLPAATRLRGRRVITALPKQGRDPLENG